MSKNFEQAYKELAQNEAPDLWDRIEAGLEDKSAPEETGKKPDKNESDKIRIFVKKYIGAAAAVLCVAIILPAAAVLKQSGEKSFSGGMMTEEAKESAQDTTAAQTAQDTTAETGGFSGGSMEDAGEGSAETEGYDNGADENAYLAEETAEAAEAADMQEMETEGSMDKAPKGDRSGAAEDRIQADLSEAKKELMDKENTAADMEKLEMAEENVLKNIVVEVGDRTDNVYGEDENELPGTLYVAVVRDDPSGTLREGCRIEIYVPSHSSYELSAEATFEVDIACKSDEAYSFTLIRSVAQED